MAQTTEQKAAERLRKKALAALRASDESNGKPWVFEWNAPEEIALQADFSAKEIKRIQNARARELCGSMPHLLQVIKPKKAVKVTPDQVEVEHELPKFDSVICDWLTIVHPLRGFHPPINDGQILKINRDGSREWTTECWQEIKSPSSDTSLRIKCDGQTFKMTGNIGRFGQADNAHGHTVAQCVEKWRKLLAEDYPKFNIFEFFGADFERVNTETGVIQNVGTRITRCDLAANFQTDNYAALTSNVMTHKINRLVPRLGKYGATWGYDSKRGNWFRGKVYDKTAELEGRRIPASGSTVARFEVQLGSELLKRSGVDILDGWKGKEMENVIFGRFSDQIFKSQATAESWNDVPARLRSYAILWRDGTPIRNQTNSDDSCRRVLRRLREYGIDASQPCNIQTLSRRIEVVSITPLQIRRVA